MEYRSLGKAGVTVTNYCGRGVRSETIVGKALKSGNERGALDLVSKVPLPAKYA